ncbi:DUF1631 domain-containing protein [Simplicispira psychrophila]|uniref:DUF1631 domain-containing protein n=1 Tax=Simplicispira psychrophila TaxID=80882 RepID=UPI00048A3C66|nr:DUF1631 domain-containing protein [Simplicispira psychrophila]
MHPPAPSPLQRRLASTVRQQVVEGLCGGMAGVDQAILDFLTELMSQTGTQRDMQERRDAWSAYQKHRANWVQGMTKAWQACLAPAIDSRQNAPPPLDFALLSDDVVENKIIASRIALIVMEHVSTTFDPLRLRMQVLEGELVSTDILRPEAICLTLVEQWIQVALTRAELQLVIDPLQRSLAELLQRIYQKCNDFLAAQGITPQQDLRVRVQRPAGSAAAGPSGTGFGGLVSQPLEQSQAARAPAHPATMASGYGRLLPEHSQRPTGGQLGAPYPQPSGLTPLARARQRAQGVMGQLRRFLTQPATGYDMVHPPPASSALVHALAAHRVQAETYYSTMGSFIEDYSPAAMAHLSGVMRQRSEKFKQTASTDSEKAIIEVVALMFQSILAEDRIPSAVRVWFARLQVPVLRVALAEPEFFSNLNHPARQLIDRMGSCVLGFDTTAVSGGALEAEIRRVVQVIEQYPETGRRVFQLVLDEFEKFLAHFLTEKKSTSQLVSVAQQIEQRETLAIQYTIELRTMLKDMPVREEIRDFLFKFWAEVLALSAVRDGAHHADTVVFKRTAADLVWAASAKPSRSDRTQVIQGLPGLLQRLRQGLALTGVAGTAQDTQLKILTDTLAEAFLSKTAAIPQEHIEAMAKRLENLEDFIDDAVMGDFPLDADSIEMMLGIDASSIHVIADNDSPVEEGMVQWAYELPLGTWFTLDHNGASAQVQYAWHSQRKQLHLFAAMDGSTYLIQLHRLGAYLQTGLLVAQEEEGLTVRATRDALAKLGANPERLLG